MGSRWERKLKKSVCPICNWKRGEAATVEVVADLERKRGLAHTTVSTLLTRLEKRGLVESRREGRSLIYRALVTETDVQKSMVADLIGSLFDGNSQALVAHLVRENEVNATDLAKIRSKLKGSDRE
jgi:BlaI family transcriptional regulator, penicillinase repressor